MLLHLTFLGLGANSYSMTGMFSFPDALVNTGLINASHLDTFMITGFLNNSPIGSFQLGTTPINFNFDTTSFTFPTGGQSQSAAGQEWNAPKHDQRLWICEWRQPARASRQWYVCLAIFDPNRVTGTHERYR